MSSKSREFPKPRPRGRFGPPKDQKKQQNAKYIDGVTVIDRSKGTYLYDRKAKKAQELLPSLLIGTKKCRACYAEVQPCKCGQPLFVSDIDVYWTVASGYMGIDFPVVRKLENIAMDEARRFGMSCVVLRSEHHATATEFDQTGRRTGRFIDADWHVTLNLGDGKDKLLLQGHVYLYMGKGTEVPQCKLKPGNRKILEPHEIFEQLTLSEAAVDVFWGINGSCGWVYIDTMLPPTFE